MDMSVWYLMGAALVFFMQCGFAMVEAGFTRSKNVGNITMKNLMDFCIGTVAFYLLGYNLLCGDGKFFGWGLNPFAHFGETDWSGFVFNLVFCATAATIVSGAMAERTKFIHIVFTVLSSAYVFTRSKLTGYGAEHHGLLILDLQILQVLHVSIW